MRILAVIPARGGSKGIPDKNIYPLMGKPLIEYTIECVLASQCSMDIAVSTDSSRIMKVASKYSEVICIPRPAELASDTASTESALTHALQYMKNVYGKEYDAVMTLQATSPLRKPETIESFVARYEEIQNEYDAMLTLHENRADHWICNEGNYERLYPEAPRRRQERKPLFIENSCIYITSVESLLATNSVLGKHANGYVISEEEGMDINEPLDITIIDSIMKSTC